MAHAGFKPSADVASQDGGFSFSPSSSRWLRNVEVIQEEATTADSGIETKRKLMRGYGRRVEGSAPTSSLSDDQEKEEEAGKAANDHSSTPSTQPLQSVTPASNRGMGMGGGGGGGGGDGKLTHAEGPLLNKERMHVFLFTGLRM